MKLLKYTTNSYSDLLKSFFLKIDRIVRQVLYNTKFLNIPKVNYERELILSEGYNSQFGQDKFINEIIFKSKTGGTFVDIGAYDGVTINNTYYFEKKLGWVSY